MWTFKTDAKGFFTNAVKRRMTSYPDYNISTRKGRSAFGYAYLQYITTIK